MGSVQWADIKFHFFHSYFYLHYHSYYHKSYNSKMCFFWANAECARGYQILCPAQCGISLCDTEKKSLCRFLPDFFCSRPVKISSHCQSSDISGHGAPNMFQIAIPLPQQMQFHLLFKTFSEPIKIKRGNILFLIVLLFSCSSVI